MTIYFSNFSLRTLFIMGLFFVSLMFSMDALAANTDWAKPVSNTINSIVSGIATFGGGFLTLIGIGYAIMGALQQRMEWGKIGLLLFVGIMIFFSDEVVVSLIQDAN